MASSVMAKSRRLWCERNDYDRGHWEGQRGGAGRGTTLREAKTAQLSERVRWVGVHA